MQPVRRRPAATPIRLALLSLLLTLAAGCKDKEMEAQNLRLQAEVKQLQDTAGEREQILQDVSQSLDSVNTALEEVRTQELETLKMSTKVNQGTEQAANQREKMLQNIRDLRKVLELRREELAGLEAKLEKMQGDNKGLRNTVAKLRKMIAEREERIKQLEAAVSDRDSKIAILETVLGEKTQLLEVASTQIQEKDATIQKQADVLNTGYFVAGTKEFLKAQGIVKETGGVLGLGRSLITSDLPPQAFRTIGITQTPEIALGCAPGKVKLVSTHPPDSYEIVAAGEKDSVLKINNAESFWKARHAVVMLKCDVKTEP